MTNLITRLQGLEHLSQIVDKLIYSDRNANLMNRLFERWHRNEQGIRKEQLVLEQSRLIVQVEAILPTLLAKEKGLHQLNNIQNRYNESLSQKRKSTEILTHTRKVDEVEQAIQKIEKLRERGGFLSNQRTRFNQVTDRLQRCIRALEQLNLVSKAEEKCNRLEQIPQSIMKLGNMKQRYLQIQQLVEQSKVDTEHSTRSIRALLTEYEDALQHAGKCPTCYSEINDSVIDQIIQEYIQGGTIDERKLRRAN